jgi:uncharacterized protein YbaP (TraB family)
MMRIILVSIGLFSFLFSQSQPKLKDKKYPSLLWEISGHGLKKPSYLFGTMHVSSKLAFHLPDSFYLALRNAQVVALETNPESWQEDMSKYDFGGEGYGSGYGGDGYMSMPSEYLGINTLKFYKYDKKIERSLYSSPSTINNLLYRSYGNETSDFEEDTYLDMYIFQCGKKWAKKVTGVENYGESMKLMAEAYRDAAKDKLRKDRSYTDRSDDYSIDKLQEAYRNGNLDMLDSINRYNSVSDAFDEKFLYKRNEIQAQNIDSIIRSGSTLFVGVGAAHLPGSRGVIEMLRKMGYKLRPVKMGERDSRDKELVEKIRVPVVFQTESADDGLFKVDIPGKFYKYGEDGALDQRQYADMANGSYYMVTRIMTNAWMWGHGSENVYKTLDSLLYENIPGKILSKTKITKNGYKGFDITNRTRRGDIQRYNIFITPFEIVFFKMSGTGEYVNGGDEAKRFFNSIQLKEYQPAQEVSWKKYSPPYGGFGVDLPHEPYIGNDGSWIYDAEDKTNNTQFRVIRSDIHNYRFAEEDTFDLGLMDESFMASEFIDTQIYRKQGNYKGYPSLDTKYKDKKGGLYLARFIIQGPHYYTLVAHGLQETAKMKDFLNSFEIKPFVYKESKDRKDTALYYTVKSPVFPEDKKIKLDIPRYSYYSEDEDGEESEIDQLESGAFRDKVIVNDTTGEKIYVSFYRSPRYFYTKDTINSDQNSEHSIWSDTAWIVKRKNKYELPNKMKVFEKMVTDSGSSRMIWLKTYYKDGIGFSLITLTDTLTQPSNFIKSFYESFTPADTLKGVDPYTKKTNLFFSDFMSKDSVLHKRAVKSMDIIEVDSSDLPQLKKAIGWLNWTEKKYLDTKKSLIEKLSKIKTIPASDYMKELYYSLDDTVDLQYVVLENLLQQETAYSFGVFRDIVANEPPVLSVGTSGSWSDYSVSRGNRFSYDNGSFMDELSDSLLLTKKILPDLLPLLNLDDYKSAIMELLGEMIDSNLVRAADYENYFSKFLIEAKQELKKQSIAEKKRAIEIAEESKMPNRVSSPYSIDDNPDSGNDDLGLYATLLLPFWDIHPNVQPLIQQMLRSNDKRLKYSTMMLLLRNKKAYPDTLMKYFAGLEEYRYELYTDLRDQKQLDKFPALYNNHLDLGKSSLLDKKSYDKPDSLVYIDRLGTTFKGKKGFIYFYKYKVKKDDMTWKLAMVGLTPDDPRQFQFADSSRTDHFIYDMTRYRSSIYNRYDFTAFTETKIEEDEPVMRQLNKALKKALYSRRKSAREFYNEDGDRTTTEVDID